ncbi:hypothetical protein Rs2_37702 [Raphanus sativus]|nr:hypothetical protein Rs2_37702 [Raphanus sativus]
MTLFEFIYIVTPQSLYPFKAFARLVDLLTSSMEVPKETQQLTSTLLISESLRRSSHPHKPLRSSLKNLQLGMSARSKDEVTLCLALKACRGFSRHSCQIQGFSFTPGFTLYRIAGRFGLVMFCAYLRILLTPMFLLEHYTLWVR